MLRISDLHSLKPPPQHVRRKRTSRRAAHLQHDLATIRPFVEPADRQTNPTGQTKASQTVWFKQNTLGEWRGLFPNWRSEYRHHIASPRASLGIRLGWTLAAAWLLFAGIEVWSGSVLVSWILPIAITAELVGLLSIVWIWSRRAVPQWLQIVLLIAAAVLLITRGYLLVLGKPSYGTDEIAFDQYAAQLLLFHGLNPYTHSMAPALSLFQVPDIYHSFTISGTEVTRISYPAGSFLAYVPALALGLRMQAAVVVDGLAWIVSMFLVWRLLPERLRWLVIPMGTEIIYLGYAAGGVTDSLFLPFLIGAYWRWDRFGDPLERSAARWAGPIMIGLAASIKQTPWFAVPFLVVGVGIEAQRRGQDWRPVVGRYVGGAGAAFLFVNQFFIVASPSAWLRGVLTPFTAHLIPAGQGFVGLTMFMHLGGRLTYYTWAGAFVVIAVLAMYIGWYQSIKRAWPALLPFVFFWPMRSFASYMVMMLPAILVGLTTVREANYRGCRFARLASMGAFGMTGLFLVGAVALHPDLSIKVLGEHSTGQLQSIDRLTLEVTNHSSMPEAPKFTITPGGQQTTFWYRTSGPALIPPNTSVIESIEAPNTESMPGLNGGFIVDAFVANPAQLITSPTIQPPVQSALITPQGIDHPVPVGRPFHLTVQLVNQLGSPLQKRGVRVALSQIVYSQNGLLPGEASIDGASEAESPISKRTDVYGRVLFTVTGVQSQKDPVFFQAWLVPASGVPTGYSDIVSVQFSGRILGS